MTVELGTQATLILFTVMILSFVSYLFIINNINKLFNPQPAKPLKSVSAGFYDLPQKMKWLTFIAYAGFCIPAMILAQTVLMMLAGFFIMLTAAAAAYNDNKQAVKVHIYAANIGIALSQASLIFDFNLWWLTCIFVVLSAVLYFTKVYTRVYWIEILAFVTWAIGISEHIKSVNQIL